MGTICLCVICAFSVLGIYTARHTVVTQQDITIEKSGGTLDSLHVVLVADLHLGYSIGNDHMKQMVKKINALDPDVVLVAGDIFDNEYEAIKDPDKVAKTLSGIEVEVRRLRYLRQSRYPGADPGGIYLWGKG